MAFHRSVLATLSQATYNCLNENGFDADKVFQQADVDVKSIYDPDARFPVSKTMRLWRFAIRETQDACLVYKTISYVEPRMLHAVGHAWITSRTLLSALKRVERYHRLLSTNVVIRLEQLQGAWQLIADVDDPSEHPATDGVIAFTLQMCRLSYGHDLVPLQVDLIRLEPLDSSAITDFFGCEVQYGASENVIVFSSADLNRTLVGANTAVADAMDDVTTDYLNRFDAQDIVSRVRMVVAEHLVHGEPEVQIVAEKLEMSQRSLQRRLEEDGTSVRKLVDETRHELALKYLDKKHLSIKEVAYSLGFNDASNFSRAFKRWEGVTPRQYRNE